MRFTAGSVDGVAELCILPLAEVVLLGARRRLRGLRLPTSGVIGKQEHKSLEAAPRGFFSPLMKESHWRSL